MFNLRPTLTKAACVLLLAGAVMPSAMAADTANAEPLTIESNIGALLDNPKTLAIIDKHIPGMSTSPEVAMARYMTFAQLVPMSSGRVTEEMVQKVEADLNKLNGK